LLWAAHQAHLPNVAKSGLQNTAQCTMGRVTFCMSANAKESPPLIIEDLSGAAAALQDSLNVSTLNSPCGINFDRSD